MKYIIPILILFTISSAFSEVPRKDRGVYERGKEQMVIDRNHIAKDGKIEKIREIKATGDGYEVNGVKVKDGKAVKQGKEYKKK